MGKQKWKVSRIEEESTVESDGLETFEEFPSGKDLILVFHDVCELGVKELEKKAIAGDVKAQFRLGMVYESGTPVIGVHPEGQDSLELYRFDIQDLTEAAKWFQLAAEQGDVGSQHMWACTKMAEESLRTNWKPLNGIARRLIKVMARPKST